MDLWPGPVLGINLNSYTWLWPIYMVLANTHQAHTSILILTKKQLAGLGLERVLEEAEEAELLDERQRLLDQAERAKLLERREGAKLLRLREKAKLRRRGGNTKVLNVLEEVDPAGSESRRARGVSKAPQNVVCATRGEGQEDRPRCTHGFRFATTSRTSKRPS